MSFRYFFFFSSRRRHTRLQGDWSSDVCSSDLPTPRRSFSTCAHPRRRWRSRRRICRSSSASRSSSAGASRKGGSARSEEHTSELQSPCNLVCRLLLEKKKKYQPSCVSRTCDVT